MVCLIICQFRPYKLFECSSSMHRSNNLSGVNQGFGNYLNINKFTLISND